MPVSGGAGGSPWRAGTWAGAGRGPNNAASLSAVSGCQLVTISWELRACRGCNRPGRLGDGIPALPGLGEEAQAGPFGELGEHVAGLDAKQGREVASGPVASGLAGHDAGDLFSSGVGPGRAGAGRLLLAAAGKSGGPVRGRGGDGDLHPGDPRGQFGPVLVAGAVPGG